jgi:carboxylesterase type B
MHGQPEAPPPSEDCLFINVFTPVDPTAVQTQHLRRIVGSVATHDDPHHAVARPTSGSDNTHRNTTAGDELLPVLVWIHGGGLCIGASSVAWGLGWDMIKDKNVLLVNFNYRCVRTPVWARMRATEAVGE